MTKEMQELLAKRDNIMASLENSLTAGTPEFKNALDEAHKVQDAIDQLTAREELKKVTDAGSKKTVVETSGFKAVADVAMGKFSNAAEKLIQGGSNGENYLIPEDVRLEINEMKKQWKSARSLCTVIPTIGITGSFNFDTAPSNGLVSFSDGAAIDDQVAPKFTRKTFTITYKGAIIPVSNLLMGNEKAGLDAYLRQWFAKRAIISENADIFAAAKSNYNSGTAKAVADWKALKTSINKDLDPAVTESADFAIVTNQSGYAFLDAALDTNGRPVLQPSPTDPTKMTFMGKRIEVFSDGQLPNRTVSTNTYAPIIYGSTKDALYFIENPNYEFATDDGKGIGFTKNQRYLRVLEGYAVMGADTSTYIYGELPIATATA